MLSLIFIIRIIFMFSIKRIISYEEIAHYIIARDVIVEPMNLLCPYAKPGYTLLAFIFIYFSNDFFGLYILRFFIILISTIAGFYCYKTLRILEFSEKESILGIFFFSIGNYSFLYQQSSLVEAMAVLFIILGYYYFELKKYCLSSVILSYCFTIRNETIFLIIILGMIYFFKMRTIKPIILFSVFPIIWMMILIGVNYDWTVLLTYNNETYFGQRLIGNQPIFRESIFSVYYYIIGTIDYFGLPLFILIIIGFIYIVKTRWIKPFGLFLLIYFIFAFLVLFLHLDQLDQFYRFLILTNSFMYIVISYGLKNLTKDLYIITKRISKDTEFIKFSEFSVYIKTILIIITLSSTSIFMSKWIYVDYTQRDRYQLEILQFVRKNYDLNSVKMLCPTELPILFMADIEPYIFLYPLGEDNYPNSTYSVVIPIKGFFYRNYARVDILDFLNKGDLIVWVNDTMYQNSTLNPEYINQNEFKIVYIIQDLLTIIVYEKT